MCGGREGRHGLPLEVHIHGAFRGVGVNGAAGASADLFHVTGKRLAVLQIETGKSSLTIVVILRDVVHGGGWHDVTGNGLFRERRAVLEGGMSIGHGDLAGGPGRSGGHEVLDNMNRGPILGLVWAVAGQILGIAGRDGLVLAEKQDRSPKR